MAYFSDRRILDTEGLVTPAAIPFKDADNLASYLKRARPDLLVIFPEWYPGLEGNTFLEEIHRITARKVIAGGPSLVIYTMPWTRPGRVHLPVE